MGIVRDDAELAEEIPGAKYRNPLSASQHLDGALRNRVEVECELSLFHHDVSDVPRQSARDGRRSGAIFGREPREQWDTLEIAASHLVVGAHQA
jgi:hypothetical protein